MRIIGGNWRSRIVRFPDTPGLRPTPDRVRQTLFDWLGQDLSGLRCLDLFAGSGALGFEALSRGARDVVMVERDRGACRALRENAARLGAINLLVISGDALEFIRTAQNGAPGAFDVVFLDAPFGQDLGRQALERIAGRLRLHGCVYFECEAKFDGDATWRVMKCGRAGQVFYHLLERRQDDQGSVSGNV
ncbi:MAG: 16S rRNA (guanine(966)-N(2))-methyltransferase RsmD [Betaproteobacteria bacterium]|nr:16S rRNA (guanine(966)-N(2))-methyltransferase RsmD [Betaproteobacteria bacterium]